MAHSTDFKDDILDDNLEEEEQPLPPKNNRLGPITIEWLLLTLLFVGIYTEQRQLPLRQFIFAFSVIVVAISYLFLSFYLFRPPERQRFAQALAILTGVTISTFLFGFFCSIALLPGGDMLFWLVRIVGYPTLIVILITWAWYIRKLAWVIFCLKLVIRLAVILLISSDIFY